MLKRENYFWELRENYFICFQWNTTHTDLVLCSAMFDLNS